MNPATIICPDCGAEVGEWCRRHGQVQPGHTLMCVGRTRAARAGAVLMMITTADGKQVTVGDRVYNYYDGRWGTIARIEPRPQPDTMKGQDSNTPIEEWSNHWFHLDNGDYLDGSRITTYDPKQR